MIYMLPSGKLDQLKWTDDGQILTISTIDGKLYVDLERDRDHSKKSLSHHLPPSIE